MHTLQTDKTRDRDWAGVALWVAVAALALSRFIHLGYGDLKDYDECLYAWRAKIIYFKGWWLDQRDLAWDGYLSAAFPPLQVWVTAILFHLFGFSEFCARFWSALAGAGTVVLLFLMGRRLGRDRATGFFAALFIGSIWDFTVYSRRGQFDVPFTFFVVACLYGYVCYLDRVRITGRRQLMVEPGAWRWLVFSGFALGLGLMSKIALALMAPIVAGAVAGYAWIRGRHSFKRIVIEQAVINGVAFLVILPWHLAMTLSPKGSEFWDWYIGYHLLRRAGTTIYLDAGPWYYYLVELWNQLPSPVLALMFVAVPWSILVIVASFWKRAQDSAHTEADAQETRPLDAAACEPAADREPASSNLSPFTPVPPDRPWDHRDLCYLLPVVWLAFPLVLFSMSGTKRAPYTIPLYPPIALLAALFLAERLHDKRRMWLLAITLFSILTVCTVSRMIDFSRDLQTAVRNFQQILLFGDVLLRLAFLLVGFAAGVVALRFLLRRHTEVFRFLSLATIVVGTTVFCIHEARRVRDPEKGTRSVGWHEIRHLLDRMDYDVLVFAGDYYDPEKWYYFNGLNLNWHPTIQYVPMPDYAPERLAQFQPETDVRVVTMWSHLEKNWTDAERKDLLSRLQLQRHSGKDFAIYRLQNTP